MSLLFATLLTFAAVPEIRLATDGKTIDVVGLSKGDLTALAERKQTPEQWGKLLSLYVDKNADRTDQPAMTGAWRIEKEMLRFEPRYGLAPGVPYRAVFDPRELPSKPKDKVTELALMIPKPKAGAATVVDAVYPKADKLPENQLKFYLHFSAPMSRGEVYQRVHLLKEDGTAIDLPFLELEQELWDREGKRLTLLFDPGRIKRGLKPREDVGPVLEEGKKYTFVIDRDWPDAAGNPLKESYRKSFRALPPDDAMPDVKMWKLQVPMAERGAVITFNKIMDHALAQRLIWVVDAKGERVPGKVELADEEKSSRCVPDKPWSAGKYKLIADTRLEDLAGNSLARPFEVDVFHPVQREVKSETVGVEFEVKAGKR